MKKFLLLFITLLLFNSCSSGSDDVSEIESHYLYDKHEVLKNGILLTSDSYAETCKGKTFLFFSSNSTVSYKSSDEVTNTSTGVKECISYPVNYYNYNSTEKTIDMAGVMFKYKIEGEYIILSDESPDGIGNYYTSIAYYKKK